MQFYPCLVCLFDVFVCHTCRIIPAIFIHLLENPHFSNYGAHTMDTEQHEQPPQLRISADGVWYYGDEPLERLGLVRLFYTVLKRDVVGYNGGYRIVTPVESIPVIVEDAPYSVVAVRSIEENTHEGIECILNDETLLPLTNTCFPRIGSNNALYIRTPNGFEARFTRAAFMQLSAYIQEEKNGGFSIISFGQTFPISLI